MMDDKIREWDQAQRDLAEAEQAVLRWQLHSDAPVPRELTDTVTAMRDHAAFLFEIVAVKLADPFESIAAPLA